VTVPRLQRPRLWCWAAAALALAGCGAETEGPRTAPAQEPEYRLEIRNQNFYAVNAYLVRATFRDRLGQVDGKTTQTFAFDWPLEEVQILLDFVGTPGCVRTEALPVVEGDDLLLIILPGYHRRASLEQCHE
jgi:hypothetical protein